MSAMKPYLQRLVDLLPNNTLRLTRSHVILSALVISFVPILYYIFTIYWHTLRREHYLSDWSKPKVSFDFSAIEAGETQHVTHSQCQQLFPGLYLEAERARKWYSERGGISKADVDAAEEQGNARLLIRNNKLWVKNYRGGINTRTQAAIAGIYRAVLTAVDALPDVDFVIQTSDAGNAQHPLFALDRRAKDEQLWLMPDFGFFSWPEPGVGAYWEVREQTLAYEMGLGLEPWRANLTSDEMDNSWSNKAARLFWRGAPMVELRQDLLRASDNQPWADVEALDWGAVGHAAGGREHGDLRSPAEHCAYKYLMHVEGWAYSGRLKYIQQCRSVIITHPLEFIQHFHHLLNPDPSSPLQNIVEVQLPLEKNLPALMEGLLDADASGNSRVESIAANSWTQLREKYLSPAANACYWRRLFAEYAMVQNFTPELEERSVPYESFVLMGTTQWDPHR